MTLASIFTLDTSTLVSTMTHLVSLSLPGLHIIVSFRMQQQVFLLTTPNQSGCFNYKHMRKLMCNLHGVLKIT